MIAFQVNLPTQLIYVQVQLQLKKNRHILSKAESKLLYDMLLLTKLVLF